MDTSIKVKDEPVEYLEDLDSDEYLQSVDEGEEDSSQSEEGDEDKSEEEEGDLEIKEEVDSENDDDNDNEHQHEESNDNDKPSSEEEESISESEDEKKSERSKVPKERHQNVVKVVKKNENSRKKRNMTAEEKLKAKRASNAASSRRLRQRRKEEAEKLKKVASSTPKRVKLDLLSKKERDRERKRLQRVQQRAQMTPEEIAAKNRELAQRKVMQRIEKKAKMTEEELAEKREGGRLLYLQKKAEKGEEMFKKKRERDNARNAKMSEEERKKKKEYGKKWRENWNEEQHEKHLEKVRKYYQRKSKKLKDQEPDKLEEMRRQWREKDKARRELERKMKAEGKEVTKKQYKKREKQGTFDRVKYLRDRRAQETPEERQKRLNQGKKNAAKRKLRKNLLEAGASAEQIEHELGRLEKTFQPSTRTLKRRTRSATENDNEGNTNIFLLGGFMPPIPFQEIEVPLPSNFVSISETTGYNTQIISYYPNYPNQQIENIEIIQEYHQLQQQQQDADSNMSIIGNVDSNSYDVQDRPKDDHVELHDFSIVSGNQPLSSSSAFFEAPSSSYSPFPVPQTLPFEESIKSDAAASENEVAANENEAIVNENEAASKENEPATIENEAKVKENETAAIENEATVNENEAAAKENKVALAASNNETAANENDAVTIPTPSTPPHLPATDEEERITTTVILPTRKGRGRPRLHPLKPPKTSRPRKLPSNPSSLVKCNICNQSYTSYTLPEHQRYYHHPNFNSATKSCTSCPSSGPFRGGRDFYLNHWKPIHLKKPKIHELIKPFICDECGATYKGQRGLEMHKETKHDNVKVSCPHCNQEFIGKPALNSHLLRLHNNEGKHPCLRCDFKAPFQDKLKTHVEKEHPSSYFPCEMCNTLKYTLADKFSHYKNCRKRPTSQTQAKLVKEGNKGKAYNQIPTKCEICEAILTLQALCKHYLEVHDVLNEKFKCEFCQKIFKKREYWVGHLEVVHEVDIFSEEMKEKMRKYYVKDRSEVVIKNPNGGHHGRFANRSFKKKRKKKSLKEEDDGNDNDEEVEEKPRRQGERRRGRRGGAGGYGGDIEKDKRLVVPLVRISEEEVQKWGRRRRKETIIKIIKEENEVESIIDDFREVK